MSRDETQVPQGTTEGASEPASLTEQGQEHQTSSLPNSETPASKCVNLRIWPAIILLGLMLLARMMPCCWKTVRHNFKCLLLLDRYLVPCCCCSGHVLIQAASEILPASVQPLLFPTCLPRFRVLSPEELRPQ